MPPSSSISNSEPDAIAAHSIARYLASGVAGGLGAVLLVSLVSWLCLSHGLVGWHFAQLYRYQLAKLATSEPVALLLVGDSSLGNAVDARAWSSSLHEPVLSLALSGDYGYRGTLNMIRRTLRQHRPKAVVIFQTLDIATRKPKYEGQIYTAERVADLAGVPPLQLLATLASLDPPLSALATAFQGPEDMSALAATDYYPQAPAGSRRQLWSVDAPPLAADEIRPLDIASLGEIAALCRDSGIRCLYMHGPLVQPQCAGSAAYIGALNEQINSTGLEVVPGTPICMPRGEAGDAEDHVAPELKWRYSQRYLRLARAVLQPRAAPPVEWIYPQT